ncbi:MAG TPA: hypothetical protein VE549_03480 [Myxococcaceae bacterium]|nr:hypothetical protein [Myxococcaceae bacterium]
MALDPPPSALERVGQTTADDRGLFLFQFFRYELARFADGSRIGCYRVDVEGGQGGALTSVFTPMNTRDIYLDRVYRWDEGELSIAPTVDGHALSAPAGPLRPADAPPGRISADTAADVVVYEWELTALAQPLWRAEKTAEPFVVDQFLREDFADVEAHANMLSFLRPDSRDREGRPSELNQFIAFRGYTEIVAGPSVVIPADSPRVPVSRGASCSAGQKRFDPCAATDGELDLAVFTLSAALESADSNIFELFLELPKAARPAIAIFRDLQTIWFAAVSIEGSADGLVWVPLATMPTRTSFDSLTTYERLTSTGVGDAARYLRLALEPPPEPITQIRLRMRNNLLAVREISLFE